MTRLTLLLALLTFAIGLTPVVGQTTTYFDVQVPNSMDVSGTELILNGAGLREKLWIDLYVGSLFLETKSSDAKAIIEGDQPMAIRVQVISSLITSDKMISACEEGFANAAKDGYTTSKEKKAQFLNVFKQDEIVDGNNYKLVYIPGTGVQIYLGDTLKATIAGLDFKRPYLVFGFVVRLPTRIS